MKTDYLKNVLCFLDTEKHGQNHQNVIVFIRRVIISGMFCNIIEIVHGYIIKERH